MKERDDDAMKALSKLRRQAPDSPVLVNEYLEIKASIMLENTFARERYPNLSGFKLHAAQVSPSHTGSWTELILYSILPSLPHGHALNV